MSVAVIVPLAAPSSVTDNELVTSVKGASFSAVIFTLTVCVTLSVPSDTVTVKLSAPVAFAVGV